MARELSGSEYSTRQEQCFAAVDNIATTFSDKKVTYLLGSEAASVMAGMNVQFGTTKCTLNVVSLIRVAEAFKKVAFFFDASGQIGLIFGCCSIVPVADDANNGAKSRWM